MNCDTRAALNEEWLGYLINIYVIQCPVLLYRELWLSYPHGKCRALSR